MRISYLKLQNYRRFKELEMQFPDGIIGVLGLNGVGKSTIIESIAWALFGNVDEVVRTSRESVKRVGAGPQENCIAVLEFELGGTEYRIEREMGGKNLSMRAELKTKTQMIAETDKSVRKMVEKLLGMDHKSFFTSVFARQKELNALQSVAAGERKKVVLRMLRIDGIDSVLTDVRGDKRLVQAKIEGAQSQLHTEDGRDRDRILAEKIPAQSATLDSLRRDLETAERLEIQAARDAEVVRRKRDDLKKDVDAYNTAMSELRARQSAIRELARREEHVLGRISAAEAKLKKLPDLEKEEDRYKSVAERKEALEKSRMAHERARSITEELLKDEEEVSRRTIETGRVRQGLEKLGELEVQMADLEKAKADCEASKSELTGKIGELGAKSAQAKESADKDRRKLDEIKKAGRQGTCPTCERALEDAFDLLVTKLTESAREAELQSKGMDEEISRLTSELSGISRKEDALKKKRARLETDIRTLKQQEASLAQMMKELAKYESRLAERKKALSGLGDVSFDAEEFSRVKAEHERLKEVHDEFTKLKGVGEQNEQNQRELGAVRDSTRMKRSEEQTYSDMVRTLEPKKSEYELTIRELDEKTIRLNQAKDALRRQTILRDKAQSELDSSKKELEEISRVKLAIEDDRKKAEDLALLEDVVVNFKDDLIGRIAPTLSELASKGLEAMTEGRYQKVELDDNYEMMIDDQGTQYPVSRFSGGESDLANLSLRLAISSIIADRTGASPINVLILDEIFGSQDPNRKRSLMTALSRLSAQFRQIFLITHIEDVKESMNYVIEVEDEEDGTSTAALVS